MPMPMMNMESLAKQMVKKPAGGEAPAEVGCEADAAPADGVDVAAEELIAAVKANDAKGVAAALRNAVSMCMTEHGGED